MDNATADGSDSLSDLLLVGADGARLGFTSLGPNPRQLHDACEAAAAELLVATAAGTHTDYFRGWADNREGSDWGKTWLVRQISQGEFTEKAWEAILGAPEVAQQNDHQIVETEHLMLVLLQQQDGLTARIFIKVRPPPSPERCLERRDIPPEAGACDCTASKREETCV